VDNKAAGEAAGIIAKFPGSGPINGRCHRAEFVASLSPAERERLGGFEAVHGDGHDFGTYCTIREMDSDQREQTAFGGLLLCTSR